jgi:hypothetical protein
LADSIIFNNVNYRVANLPVLQNFLSPPGESAMDDSHENMEHPDPTESPNIKMENSDSEGLEIKREDSNSLSNSNYSIFEPIKRDPSASSSPSIREEFDPVNLNYPQMETDDPSFYAMSEGSWHCIGKGTCGTVWTKLLASGRPTGFVLKRGDAEPRTLSNEADIHKHLLRHLGFLSVP